MLANCDTSFGMDHYTRLNSIVEKCMAEDQRLRPSAEEVLGMLE